MSVAAKKEPEFHGGTGPKRAEPKYRRGTSDPLVRCLSEICKAWHLPFNATTCLSGVPLPSGRLELDQLPLVARRLGIVTRTRKMRLSALKEKHCPLILLLEGQDCVVVGTIDPSFGFFEILENGRRRHVPRDQFKETYSGSVIEISPEPRLFSETEAEESAGLRPILREETLRNLPFFGEVLLASLVINLFVLAVPFFMMNVYDRVVPNLAMETLWALAIGVTIALLFDFVIKNLRANVIDGVGLRIGVDMEYRLMDRLLSVRLSDRPQNAGMVTNCVQEFSRLASLFPSGLVAVLIDLPFFFIYLVIIFMIGGVVALAPLAGAILIVASGLLTHFLSTRANKEASEFQNQKFNSLIETVTGLEYFKSHNAQGQVLGEWDRLIDSAAFSGRSVQAWNAVMGNLSGFLVQAVTILVVIIGVYEIQAGSLSVGGLVACTILSGRAMLPLSNAVGLLVRVYKSVPILKTISSLLHMPTEKAEDAAAATSKRLSGNIEFVDVSFTYPNSTVPSLREVSFSIQPEHRVALIGKIGSGKSTIIRLLLNLYQPTEGTILFDGVDVDQLHAATIRASTGTVLQDPFLIDGTIHDNLTLGLPGLSEEDVERAMALSGVKDFVSRHPAGLSLRVGPRGSHLSGGQRQAIGLARALIHKPPILVMDEPTASFDSTTELQFIEHMKTIVPGRTVILSTHRVKLLELVDRIIWMDRGRVLASGPVDEVLSALSGKGHLQQG